MAGELRAGRLSGVRKPSFVTAIQPWSLPAMTPLRPAPAPAASASVQDADATFCFSIQAAADPATMPRVIALFAKRGLVPSKWVAVLSEAGTLEIDLQMPELAAEAASYIAECLRQLVSVRAVLVATRPR
jgi:hypothetical protein